MIVLHIVLYETLGGAFVCFYRVYETYHDYIIREKQNLKLGIIHKQNILYLFVLPVFFSVIHQHLTYTTHAVFRKYNVKYFNKVLENLTILIFIIYFIEQARVKSYGMKTSVKGHSNF